jgi:hypothetical protein
METQSKHKNCVHHWIIDDPNGVYSFGRCTRCGLVKRFVNNWEEFMASNGKDVDAAKVQPRM